MPNCTHKIALFLLSVRAINFFLTKPTRHPLTIRHILGTIEQID
jgi:hypothetical protein